MARRNIDLHPKDEYKTKQNKNERKKKKRRKKKTAAAQSWKTLLQSDIGLTLCFPNSDWRNVFQIRTSAPFIKLVKSTALIRQKIRTSAVFFLLKIRTGAVSD